MITPHPHPLMTLTFEHTWQTTHPNPVLVLLFVIHLGALPACGTSCRCTPQQEFLRDFDVSNVLRAYVSHGPRFLPSFRADVPEQALSSVQSLFSFSTVVASPLSPSQHTHQVENTWRDRDSNPQPTDSSSQVTTVESVEILAKPLGQLAQVNSIALHIFW